MNWPATEAVATIAGVVVSAVAAYQAWRAKRVSNSTHSAVQSLIGKITITQQQNQQFSPSVTVNVGTQAGSNIDWNPPQGGGPRAMP